MSFKEFDKELRQKNRRTEIEHTRVSGAIFDCDGTLLDSLDVWLATQNELGRRAGVSITAEESSLLCTYTIPEVGAYFHTRYGLGGSSEDVIDSIDELMALSYSEKVRPRRGALEFVQGLYELGIPCSVASSTPQNLLEIALEATGFSPFLSAIVSVDRVGVSKRSPDVYDFSCELMDTEKKRTWVFEDALYALETLISADYYTVGIYCDDTTAKQDELQIADIFIKEFTELDAKTFVQDPFFYTQGV